MQNALLGTGGQLMSPLPWQEAAQGNVNSMLNAIMGQTGTQLKGTELASALMTPRVGLEQESLWRILLPALLGAGGANLPSILKGVGGLFGGSNTNTTDTSNPGAIYG